MKKRLKRFTKVMTVMLSVVGIITFIRERRLAKNSRNQHKPYGIYERYVKRPLDAMLSAGALIVLAPVMAVTAVIVRVKLGSPVIFTQDRPGKNEKIFKLYKFRTMTDERDENGELLPDTKRLTQLGKTLRATSLDELPELINILKGDMSLVGPRPLLIQYLPYYTEEEKKRHDVLPGLTGLAQVNGRNFLEWDKRLALDAKYVGRITFFGDLKIVADTIMKVLKKDDVAVDTSIDEGYLDEIRRNQG